MHSAFFVLKSLISVSFQALAEGILPYDSAISLLLEGSRPWTSRSSVDRESAVIRNSHRPQSNGDHSRASKFLSVSDVEEEHLRIMDRIIPQHAKREVNALASCRLVGSIMLKRVLLQHSYPKDGYRPPSRAGDTSASRASSSASSASRRPCLPTRTAEVSYRVLKAPATDFAIELRDRRLGTYYDLSRASDLSRVSDFS
jgi:hypothetical protein